MSWNVRSAPCALICASLLLLTSHRCQSQWFAGNLRDTTNRADYIIITSAAYAGTVQPLAAYRASHQSLAVLTVLMDSITAQFPRATPDSSVRDFVTKTLTQWRAPHPQFLLLAGNVNVVPSHMIKSSFPLQYGEDSVAIDQWFVNQLTENQTYPTPALALGRLPAWSQSDLQAIVGKTLAYEQATPAAWATRSIAVVDSQDYMTFEEDAASFQRLAASRWGDTITVHVRSNSQAHRSRAEFRDLWNRGSAIVNFIGHISGPKFSAASYFTSQDVDSLSAGSPLPMCLLSGGQHFEYSDTIPIAVALLRPSDRGAVCVTAPTGLMYASVNAYFQDSLMAHLTRWPDHAIGTAWLSVQQAPFSEIEKRYTLFGDPALVIKSSPVTSVPDPALVSPSGFALSQNYPNPFNPITSIVYAIEGTGHEALGTSMVKLSVYDMLGREVAVLVNERKEAGTYMATWDGRGMASGLYVYRIQSGSFVQSRKMMLLK